VRSDNQVNDLSPKQEGVSLKHYNNHVYENPVLRVSAADELTSDIGIVKGGNNHVDPLSPSSSPPRTPTAKETVGKFSPTQ
jgi:hypothetical protein